MVLNYWFLIILLLRIQNSRGQATEDVPISPRGIVSIQRSIQEEHEIFCNFTGSISIAGPSSLEQDDKFFNIGSQQLVAVRLMVDYINRYQCGITSGDQNYKLQLSTYDDQSSTTLTTAIANQYLQTMDIWLGGYSSTLTLPLAEASFDANKLLLAPGAAATGVFRDRNSVFGTFPPTAKYLAKAIEGLANLDDGPKTLATLWEDASFTRGVCAAAPDLAEQHGMEITSQQVLPGENSLEDLVPLARQLAEEDPDVVISCVYDCAPWMEAMRNVSWSPKAQVFTVCVGLQSFLEKVGTDTDYVMGVTPWDSSLNIQDEVTGWSAQDFARIFRKETAREDVTYHPASAAAVISILAQTLENTYIYALDTSNNETLTDVWSDYIRNNSFRTMYGQISFDANGQSLAPSLLIQYDGSSNGTVRTVYPKETSSGPILYPMPSWDRRDCLKLSACEISSGGNNFCDEDGYCVCDDTEFYEPVGKGATAQCVPAEDFNYILGGLKVMSYVEVGLLLLFCGLALFWTLYYRKNTLVRVSQPIFLQILILGSAISSLSILALGIEAGYREEDSATAIGLADAGCMGFPWLWGLGFAITYSALFAKVWRVKRLYRAAHRARRRQVKVKDVMMIMGVVIFAEVVILLIFQFVSPLRWERYVIQDINGYTVSSVGRCDSDYGWIFMAVLVVFNVSCLIYALVLCWQTKDLPSDFSERNYIFLSVMFKFQILILAIPVTIMVKSDPNTYFFTMVSAVFLQNCTVLAIIFAPKVIRIFKGEDTQVTIANTIHRTMTARRLNTESQYRNTVTISDPSQRRFTESHESIYASGSSHHPSRVDSKRPSLDLSDRELSIGDSDHYPSRLEKKKPSLDPSERVQSNGDNGDCPPILETNKLSFDLDEREQSNDVGEKKQAEEKSVDQSPQSVTSFEDGKKGSDGSYASLYSGDDDDNVSPKEGEQKQQASHSGSNLSVTSFEEVKKKSDGSNASLCSGDDDDNVSPKEGEQKQQASHSRSHEPLIHKDPEQFGVVRHDKAHMYTIT